MSSITVKVPRATQSAWLKFCESLGVERGTVGDALFGLLVGVVVGELVDDHMNRRGPP